MNFEDCSEPTDNPIITVSEKGRKFTINNNNRKLVVKIRVDGCLINDHRPRCDYIFEINSPCNEAIYLELKGKDIQKAYNQISSTLGYLDNRHRQLKRQCHIVASRVPRISASIQVFKTKIKKQYKADLFIHTSQGQIEI